MSWLSEVSARAETAEELELGMARVAAMYESAADVPRLVALVEQLGEALEREHHILALVLARRSVRDVDEGRAEADHALAAYRAATE